MTKSESIIKEMDNLEKRGKRRPLYFERGGRFDQILTAFGKDCETYGGEYLALDYSIPTESSN